MKKYLLIVCVCVVAMCMTSCSLVKKTATTRQVTAPIAAIAIGDLDVSNQKITYQYIVPKNIRKGGRQNCINAAIREALAANGDADVLVETQSAVVETGGMYGGKVKMVTITGYPAKYKNFRSANEQTVNAAIVEGRFFLNK